jgi:5-methylcytosine-specific restriction protein A
MPWLYRRCAYPGCVEKIVNGSYCDRHRKEKAKAYDAGRDPQAVKFYNSKRWRNIRQAKLNESPLCERCLSIEKRIEEAVTVDHIDGNIENNADENLHSLCLSCHSKKEIEVGHRF